MERAKPSTSKDISKEKADEFSWPVAIKSGKISYNFDLIYLIILVIGISSVGGIAFGYKLYRQSFLPESKGIPRAQLISGVTLASRALLTATIWTVSGFSLFIVSISMLLKGKIFLLYWNNDH